MASKKEAPTELSLIPQPSIKMINTEKKIMMINMKEEMKVEVTEEETIEEVAMMVTMTEVTRDMSSPTEEVVAVEAEAATEVATREITGDQITNINSKIETNNTRPRENRR